MKHNETSQSVIDLRRHWRALRRGWWLYVLSLAVMLGLAGYYAANKQQQYRLTATVLIEDDKDNAGGIKMMGGLGQIARTFSLGNFSSSVDNEWLVMSSHDVYERAVKTLGLNRTYVQRTGLFTKRLLYRNSPILLDAPDAFFDTLSVSMRMTVDLHNGKADVKMSRGRWKKPFLEKNSQTLPCTLQTPYGPLQLLKSSHFQSKENRTIVINVASNNEMAAYFQQKVDIGIKSKKGDAIVLRFKDDKQRGLDLLNALVDAYNAKRSDRKNEKAMAEVQFVDNRIAALQHELSEAEGKVAQFKKDNNVYNPMLEAQGWLKESTTAQAEAAAAQSEMATYEMILNTLKGASNGNETMLPSFEGVKDPSVVQYNELIAKRRTLAQSASEGNAALNALDQQIEPLRKSIIQRAEKNIEAARIKLNAIYGQAGRAQGRFSQMPGYERTYFDLLRDRELKNDLYVFLLEKKESSLLKLNSSVSPSFVLDKAYSSIKPDQTKALIVLGVALLLGLLLPTLLLLWLMRRRDRLISPIDLPAQHEPQAVTLGDDAAWLDLFTRCIQIPGTTMVLVADAAKAADMLADHIEKMEFDATCLRADTPAQLKEAQTIGTPDTPAIAVVDDWHRADALLRLCDQHTTTLLLLTKPGTLRRKEFNQHFAHLDAGRCVVGFLRR